MANLVTSKIFIYVVDIPVNSTNGHNFFEDVRAKGMEIHAVICKIFPYFAKISRSYFSELALNSRDAMIGKGLRVGDELQLKIVVKEKKSGTVVKFKDNGTGFLTREKGTRFEYEIDKDRTRKSIQGQSGGGGFGLDLYVTSVRTANGSVTIKNRRLDGVSIDAFFPGSYANSAPEDKRNINQKA